MPTSALRSFARIVPAAALARFPHPASYGGFLTITTDSGDPMSTPTYAMIRTVDLSYEEADRRIRAALEAQGFGILTEIDVRATLKKRLDADVPAYEILGACMAPLAHQAILAEPDIGLLLPCNLVVRATDDPRRTIVEALDPAIQLGIAAAPALAPLADQVRDRIVRALDEVAAAAP